MVVNHHQHGPRGTITIGVDPVQGKRPEHQARTEVRARALTDKCTRPPSRRKDRPATYWLIPQIPAHLYVFLDCKLREISGCAGWTSNNARARAMGVNGNTSSELQRSTLGGDKRSSGVITAKTEHCFPKDRPRNF